MYQQIDNNLNICADSGENLIVDLKRLHIFCFFLNAWYRKVTKVLIPLTAGAWQINSNIDLSADSHIFYHDPWNNKDSLEADFTV